MCAPLALVLKKQLPCRMALLLGAPAEIGTYEPYASHEAHRSHVGEQARRKVAMIFQLGG